MGPVSHCSAQLFALISVTIVVPRTGSHTWHQSGCTVVQCSLLWQESVWWGQRGHVWAPAGCSGLSPLPPPDHNQPLLPHNSDPGSRFHWKMTVFTSGADVGRKTEHIPLTSCSFNLYRLWNNSQTCPPPGLRLKRFPTNCFLCVTQDASTPLLLPATCFQQN